MCQLTLANFSVHIEVKGALNLEPRNCGGRTIAKTIGNENTWRSGIVFKTIIIVIDIVSDPEFLLLTV